MVGEGQCPLVDVGGLAAAERGLSAHGRSLNSGGCEEGQGRGNRVLF